jgi:LSD1 subclass zinc finger protein
MGVVCLFASKATTLDKTWGPAWLAYGHSFAADNEHDQAMAAYFTASQIMKGYVVCIGCTRPLFEYKMGSQSVRNLIHTVCAE